MLSQHLPRTDEFEGSDAAVMAALAFAVEVLKYPFEMLCQPDATALCTVNTKDAAAPAAVQVVGEHQQNGDNLLPGEKPGTQTGSPDGALQGRTRVHNSKSDGESPQCSRTAATTKASAEKQSSPSSLPAVGLSGQCRSTDVEAETLTTFGRAWTALYKALHEVSAAASLRVYLSVCLHPTCADCHKVNSNASWLATTAAAILCCTVQ